MSFNWMPPPTLRTTPDNPWTISVNGEEVAYDLAENALELAPDTMGVVTLSDGSELSFEGVEIIQW